jgi:dihydrodipicolinate synthase/N-acetylneuraminate lyase
LSGQIFEACVREDYETAEKLRAEFLPLEDLRDAWSPAKVLHFATRLAGVAETGPTPPFLSSLSEKQSQEIAPVARALFEQNKRG